METRILSGNEILIQGGLEAGFSLYTGYPGSPLADYFNILYAKREQFGQKGIKVVLANSEANAAAMASGAKMAGQDTLVAMKSMGLHVAADALSVGNFANPGPTFIDPETKESYKSGVVVVVGDDPWSISTSTPADSRYLFKHLHIPFLEPSTPQELKDWIKVALKISQRSSIYIGLLLTTAMAEGGGRIKVGSETEPRSEQGPVNLDPNQFNLRENVMVPPNSLAADHTMVNDRFPKVKKIFKELKLDKISGVKEAPIGIITSGVIAETLKQFLDDYQLLEHFSLYKLASSYPIVEEHLLPYLKNLEHVIVVEEKRGFLEGEVLQLMQQNGISTKIWGKKFNGVAGFPESGGLSYEIIFNKFYELLKLINEPNIQINTIAKSEGSQNQLSIPLRPPTFCPGCPHRETLSLLKDLRKTLEKQNINLLSHGDVGCYSLAFLRPFGEMHDLSAMGQGGAMGAGTDLFASNPSVVLMGDSTFFHSGMSAISNSLQLGHNITYILLDNDNTAMTGHQMTPVSGISVEGIKRPRQNMLSIVKSMGVEDTVEVNPSDRYFYKNLLYDYVNRPGLKVIISNKECGLTYHGKVKKLERAELASKGSIPKKTFYQINQSVCEDCRECVDMTGCPGLTKSVDAYGPKIDIDPQICVADSYCTKLKACPSFEKVDVIKYFPQQIKFKNNDLEKLNPIPLPQKLNVTLDDLASGRDYRIVVTGVGGSGVTTISRILAKAALEMGGRDDIDFKFFDQKGLAQRNGAVTGHLSFFKKGKSHGTTSPEAMADLLLSPDLLEGMRNLRFLSTSGEAFIDSMYQVPLSIILDRGEIGDTDRFELMENGQKILKDRGHFIPFKDISHELLGKSVYASTILVGAVFQKGHLPFVLEDLCEAIKKAIPREEVDSNLQAFNIGRTLSHLGLDEFSKLFLKEKENNPSDEDYLIDLMETFPFWYPKKSLMESFYGSLEVLTDLFPKIERLHLRQYLYDIMLFSGKESLDKFLNYAKKISNISNNNNEVLALRILAKTYFIKDEVFVAHQLVSKIKRKKDLAKYASLGDHYYVGHINRPSFVIFNKTIEFDFSPKDWMLKIMRRLRFMRKFLSQWHIKEKKLSRMIRKEILVVLEGDSNEDEKIERLKGLDNIKGYREIRWKNAQKVFQELKDESYA